MSPLQTLEYSMFYTLQPDYENPSSIVITHDGYGCLINSNSDIFSEIDVSYNSMNLIGCMDDMQRIKRACSENPCLAEMFKDFLALVRITDSNPNPFQYVDK